MLEGVISVAAAQLPPRRSRPSGLDEAMRAARSCYDHIAGRLDVDIADALVARGYVVLSGDGGEVTSAGSAFLSDFGVELGGGIRRAYCRPCLDWSERRWHIAGAVGAALYSRLLQLGWIERRPATRALHVTARGRLGFETEFRISAVAAAPEATGR
jgi:hypothetical protein